ncbi:MAG: SpoIIE family protein phosphatase [Chloroflexi bacterium]|nr:SpoIIE family protein phosphatase [Chloroflexota bacterium]
MQVRIGVSKLNKYASAESGDTLEVVERPNGGLSIVLADGQRSGKSAKRISNMVVRKVISLLAEGVRDGAAARAASDYLFSHRQGHVQSTLNILSVDLESKSLVLTRNNPVPLLITQDNALVSLDEDSVPVGIYRATRPVIREFPLSPDLYVIAYTDGLVHAGERSGKKIDIKEQAALLIEKGFDAQDISDVLLNLAFELDQGRPLDDISVVTLRVTSNNSPGEPRRLTISLPIS